ncbi:MAG: hypothetical protein KKB51_23305 [Candidatus Riflebacteria bacterium]|nr:hypothetical protein [Candidatus Riflebacteria bacterium]
MNGTDVKFPELPEILVGAFGLLATLKLWQNAKISGMGEDLIGAENSYQTIFSSKWGIHSKWYNM